MNIFENEYQTENRCKFMDIIIFALARWDGPYTSTTFSLAQEFAKNHRVFYIENPLTIKYVVKNFRKEDVKSRIRPLLSGSGKYKKLVVEGNLTIVTPAISIPVNFLPKGRFYNFLSAVNDKCIGKLLKNLIRDFGISEFIFVNIFNPFYAKKLPPAFKPNLFVYMSVDNIEHSVHVDKHGSYLENEMISKADIVFCTSKELCKIKSKFSNNVHLLPNAANVANFQKVLSSDTQLPPELSGITKPIIIYIGHLDIRFDTALMKYLLKTKNEYHFLMVGPISLEKNVLSELKSYPNIQFVGSKPAHALPIYLKYSNCAIIPFKCNELTKSIYPLKINEYLAVGKPVVSTAFSEDIQDFKKVIYIAETHILFAASIDQALYSHSDELVTLRTEFVKKNNWENRAERFWKIVSSKLTIQTKSE